MGLRHLAVAAAVTLLAAALRFPRLLETPGWDGDEGYNLELAWQLLHGHAQAFAVTQSFVQHPILFYALLAPLLALFGPQLVVARALAAVSGALTVGVIYLAARRGVGTRAAVWGATTFAAAHFIVLHNRLAYTYDLLLLLTALTLWLGTRYEQTHSRVALCWASVAAALGLLTAQLGVALPLFLALRAWPRRRDAALALAIGVSPALVFASLMAAVAPIAALEDWSASVGRLSVGGPGVAVAQWFVNYFHLLRAEWWWPLAVAGLLCVREEIARRRLLVLAALLVVPAFAIRELEPFFRTGIPLFVPAAVGLGAALDAGLSAVYRTLRPRAGRVAAAAFLVVLPLGFELARSAGATATSFQTRFDWALVVDQAAARAAADEVNAHRGPDDFVLISPHVAWLYQGRRADFFQAVAWTGDAIAFYPASMARTRFTFEPSVDAARYAVVDAFWLRWVDASPPLAALTARVLAWPEALHAGDVSVRRNPR